MELQNPGGRNVLTVSTVQYSTVQYSTVQYSTVQYSTVQYSTVQYSTVQYSTVQYSTVQYSTVQYSTVQYSTVQYSTVQYSTVQYSTVQALLLLRAGSAGLLPEGLGREGRGGWTGAVPQVSHSVQCEIITVTSMEYFRVIQKLKTNSFLNFTVMVLIMVLYVNVSVIFQHRILIRRS